MVPISWFRFGIPLGSATVLAALLELGISCYWALNDFGSFFYFHIWDNQEPVDYRGIIGLVAITLRCCLTVCLWVFVLLGHRVLLLVWLPLSVIADILIIGHGVNNITRESFVSDEIWFLNLAAVLLIRLYITSVIYQTLYRLLKNAKIEASLKSQGDGFEECAFEMEVNPTSEDLKRDNNGTPVNCPSPDSDDISVDNTHLKSPSISEPTDCYANPRFLLVEPIGENVEEIFEYYYYTPRLGAALLVTFELVWNIFTLGTHSLTEFLFGGKMFFMIDAEEIFMRAWRIVVDLVALYFIVKRRKTLLRFWLIVYFWTLFFSLWIFVYFLADWLYPPVVTIIVTFTLFIADNFIRFSIVYLVLRTTTQPPVLTPSSDLSPAASGPETEGGKRAVVRSHSLKSQTHSRIRRISRVKRKYAKTMRMGRLSGVLMDTDFLR